MSTQGFWSAWWWPAVSAALVLVFAALVFRQYLSRRKAHQLWWSIGLFMYAAAAGIEAYSEFVGAWEPTVYRVYWITAASLVGFLGLGTLYLTAKRRIWGDIFLGYLAVCLVVTVWGVFATPLDTAALQPGITVGGAPLGEGGTFPRAMSMAFTIPGSLFLILGSAYSAVMFWPKKEFRYRSWANVLIALGALLIAAAGSMARSGETAGLYPAEMVASAVLFAGFIMASTLEKGAKAAREHGQERRAREAAEQVDTGVPGDDA